MLIFSLQQCYNHQTKYRHMGLSMFIGREIELKKLEEFRHDRRIAGLIVCSGRRRIGKSTLIEKFAEGARFLEFQGLAPRPNMTNQIQLDHFGTLMGTNFGIPPMKFDGWHHALATLAGLTKEGECIIFLDEISWMASQDKDFSGKLKTVWDTQFKKNPRLILVICGSVSSWIQNNILEDKGFMGRVSYEIHLQELPLYDADKFWFKNQQISAYEKFKVLCVTGGIPRYLEEIKPHKTAEQNIKSLCFTAGGILLDEFDKIFKDIFEYRAEEYKRIVLTILHRPLSTGEICEKLNVKQSGSFNKKLKALVQCGFLQRDYAWHGNKKVEKQSLYRLCDNYLRFYLKYIEPKRDLIEQGLYDNLHLEELEDWRSIMGLQFENLVLNNIKILQGTIDISPASLLSAAPYFQNKTLRQEACQVDLLIQTKFSVYVCEIKFRHKIGIEVIDEVREKIRKLSIPKSCSVRPVLIYQGELSTRVGGANFFSHLICFEDLLSL